MVKKKYTAIEIKKIVQLFVKMLEENKIAVDKIILYGSYAKGTVRDYSDIDLAIISPVFKKKKMFDIQAELAKIFAKYLSVVEVIGYSSDTYKSAKPETLLGEIKQSGKILYDAEKI